MPIASSLLNKPRLVKKLRDFYDYVNKNDGKVGTKTRGIDLNFNNACNLRCKYCFTNSPKGGWTMHLDTRYNSLEEQPSICIQKVFLQASKSLTLFSFAHFSG